MIGSKNTRTTTMTTSGRRTSTLERPVLMRLAAVEYDRCAALLGQLRPTDWGRPTECPEWDVRDLVSHMLGMAEMAASIPVAVRQMRSAKQRGGVFVDALTAVQVDERRALSGPDMARRFGIVAPRAARARRRTPGLVRRLALPEPQDAGAGPETWSMGYLLDTILTRDPWMHRVDLARAVGVDMVLTADHDGVLVADVVTEWAARHGQPCELELGGPAGGQWSFGDGGPVLAWDAVEFCRAVSGRAATDGLFHTHVPF